MSEPFLGRSSFSSSSAVHCSPEAPQVHGNERASKPSIDPNHKLVSTTPRKKAANTRPQPWPSASQTPQPRAIVVKKARAFHSERIAARRSSRNFCMDERPASLRFTIARSSSASTSFLSRRRAHRREAEHAVTKRRRTPAARGRSPESALLWRGRGGLLGCPSLSP